MKNNKKIILCGMMFLLLTLTACQNNEVNNSGKEQNTETQNTEIENVIQQKSAILEMAEKTDDDSVVYYIYNERVESGVQQEIGFYQGNLLLWGYGQNADGETGFQISLISLQTGEVLQEKPFSQMDLPSLQICGEKIAVSDWGAGKVYVLDEEFQIIKEYETGTEYCGIYVSPDATDVFCFVQDGVQVHDIEEGYQHTLFEDATMLFASIKCGDTISVTYTNKNTQLNEEGVIDLSTGEAMTIPFDGAFQGVEYNDGIWFAGAMDEWGTYYLGKTQRPNVFTSNEGSGIVTLLANPGRLMETSYDEDGATTISVYGLDGSFLSQCKLGTDVAIMTYEPIWSEADGGYFLLVTDVTGQDRLLFWDMSIPVAGEGLTLTSAYDGNQQTSSEVSQELLDRAEEISETYNVEIIVGDQIDGEYFDYYVACEMDETYISAALDSVEAALGKYPAGFMGQLLYGNQKELEIHLGGAFTMKDLPEEYVNGFTSYVGLAEEQAGKTVIVVDITTPGSMEQTLHHEIMHVIDNKLAFDASIREDALYSEEAWSEFNPAGFVYPETRLNLPDDIYNDGYESYFIDIYSRTFATEDRARIMEYAMVEADWAFSGSQGRYEKLEFLCDCIRDAFDTEGWPEQTLWEQTLEQSK